LLHHKLISTKYYIKKDEDELLSKLPHWYYLYKFNYENSNFYFLVNNFFQLNSNFNSFFVNYSNSNLNSYDSSKDYKKLFPSAYDYSSQDISFLNDYLYIRNSSFIDFFLNNMIDVPICFKKSSSLKTRNFELPLLKFSNFLMWEGKREKIVRTLFKSFRFFFNFFKFNKLKNSTDLASWFSLYNLTNFFNFNFSVNSSFKFNYNFQNPISLNHSNNLTILEKTLNFTFFLKNYLYFLLSKVSPIFSYFIYSVDKNIRKYSRGKSGKYTFIWKFVAPYKRIKLSTRLIVKDIKFYQSRRFKERLAKTFENLYFSPEKSFSWKSKTFSHNYVFRNFRKSLMSSLRTTS
jgi:hypothetical protein